MPGQAGLRWRGARLSGWELVKGAVWPGGVVVLQVPGQDLAQVALVEDEQPAGDFAAQGGDHRLADRIRLGRLRRAEEDPDTCGGEDGAGGLRELAGAVTDQEPGGVGVVADVHPLPESDGAMNRSKNRHRA